MIIFLLFFSLLLAIFSVFLCWQVLEQRKIIAQMMAQVVEQDTTASLEKEPDMLLTLKILHPIAVAKRESRSARVMADKLPVMVRKMVYQSVMKELKEELAEREIDVEMHIEYR
ncbi:MAG: hypothetical protein ACTHYN_06790 [Marinobacter sp.]|uniref:hypothetical protein n=1 Tax=Marinobacter sp. TaxID=50741 RepID=UPI003F996DB1